MQNVLTLKSILWCFEIASEVNLFKSSLIGINVERRVIQVFAETLNCKMMDMPFTYLGLSIGANPRSLVTWQPMIEKMKKHLSS